MRLEYRRLEHEEEETIKREEALAAGTGGRYYELKGARRMNEREFFESLEERNAEAAERKRRKKAMLEAKERQTLRSPVSREPAAMPCYEIS